MKVRITKPVVRMPDHPEAKRGAVPVGAIADVPKPQARNLVRRGVAEYVDEDDRAKGPVSTIEFDDSADSTRAGRGKGKGKGSTQTELATDG